MIPEFLIKMLENQYGQDITKQILDGYSMKRKVTFRVNTLKDTVDDVICELLNNQIDYERVPWSEVALVINNADEDKLREMDIYKEGKIYLQSLSSMLPPIILDPKPNMDILDMTAAPGGKTTQMAVLTENKAHITACEMNKIRAEKLKYNVEKQGATCVYVMEKDSRNIDDFFSFDQILLDAPCSGSGTLNENDKSVFTEQLIEKSTAMQIALLKKAIKILKPGHEMVYSTCSILSCENEDVVNKIINDKKCEIIPIFFEGIETIPKLETSINGALCVKPTDLYEGFFVVKIRRKK